LDFDEYLKCSTQFDRPQNTLASDPILLFFTSGTTGRPKMVIQRNSYAFMHIHVAKWQNLSDGDLFYCVADTGWAKNA